jgi:hypothetical protein
MLFRIRDPGIFLTLNPGSGIGKIRIRDKHPGSATLLTSLRYFMETFLWTAGIRMFSHDVSFSQFIEIS